jgi:hypothetical protein
LLDLRILVSEEQRPPAHAEVEVGVAVFVAEPSAFGRLDKYRGSTHTAETTYR